MAMSQEPFNHPHACMIYDSLVFVNKEKCGGLALGFALHYALPDGFAVLSPRFFLPFPATCALRPAICDLRPATCDLRPATCDLRPATSDLRPVACNTAVRNRKNFVLTRDALTNPRHKLAGFATYIRQNHSVSAAQRYAATRKRKNGRGD
jgi:hypothetical protein